MNLARGSICWRDFDGVKKRICDVDNGSPDFQCPNAATKMVIGPNGDVIYACSEACLRAVLLWGADEDGPPRQVHRIAITPGGIGVYL
jgi:hypothetical protein